MLFRNMLNTYMFYTYCNVLMVVAGVDLEKCSMVPHQFYNNLYF